MFTVLGVYLIAIVVVAALWTSERRASGEAARRRIAKTGALVSAVRLACLVLLAGRAWTHQASYADLLFVLPLLPEALVADRLPWQIGADFSLNGLYALLTLAALLVAGSFLLAMFVEWLGRRVRGLAPDRARPETLPPAADR